MTFQRTVTSDHTVAMETVTPDIARHWLNSRPYRGQRELKKWHVKHLAEEMERGNFRAMTQIAFSVEDGRHYLINGQHTLNAIVLCGIPQTLVVFCYQSTGEEDTAETYGVIDTNMKRTFTDLTSAMFLKEELALTSTNLIRVAAAARLIGNKFSPRGGGGSGEHNDDMVRRIREYAPAAHQFFDTVIEIPAEMRSIYRAASFGVGLVTFRFSAQLFSLEKVKSFWQGVAFNDGIKQGDARKVAHRHILTSAMSNPGNSRTKTSIVSAYYSARVIALCFNKYMMDQELNIAKVPDASAPIKIIGSPFTGKE